MARFIMVARSHDGKRPMPVNTLSLNGSAEAAVFDAGAKAASLRKHRLSLKTKPPTSEESAILHTIFLQRGHAPSVSMQSTRLRTIRVCHPQERNLHDLVFGGILMREAFELAFATTSLYCRGRPLFLAIDELAFVHPVPIGSILELSATIVYTIHQPKTVLMHVQVIADVINVQSSLRVTTNTFHLTFQHNTEDGSGADPPAIHPVLPDTYEEGVKYIEGMRRLKNAETDSRPSPFDLVRL